VPGFFGMQRVSTKLWVEPGMPAAARADLQYAFLLGPRGLAAPILTHEWAHAELDARLGRRLPTPSLNEMMTFPQMLEAGRRYGDTRRDSTLNHHVVYTTAAHELRGWLARTGHGGVLQLIPAMNAGEPFGSTYVRLGGEAASLARGVTRPSGTSLPEICGRARLARRCPYPPSASSIVVQSTSPPQP
jgi:hypothetical protein